MRRTLFLLFFVLLLAAGNSRADPLRLVTLDYPPYEYQENGEVKGVATLLVREVFHRMGRDVDIEVLPWARSLKMVREGAADGVYTIFQTPERDAFLDYCRVPLMDQVTSLFVKKDSLLRYAGDLGEIGDRTIGVVRSVSYGRAFDSAVRDGVLRNLDVSETGLQNVKKLLLGRFDILAGNRLGTLDLLKQVDGLGKVRELGPPLQTLPCYVAFSKKRGLVPLRDEFDRILGGMKENGEWEALVSGYFSPEGKEQDSVQQVPMMNPE